MPDVVLEAAEHQVAHEREVETAAQFATRHSVAQGVQQESRIAAIEAGSSTAICS